MATDDEFLTADEVPPVFKAGPYRLWLAVVMHAVKSLQTGKDIGSARTFILDPENPFLDAVCDGLGISPEALRERAAKMGIG